MHSPDSCEKTASHTPVSTQEKKCLRNLIKNRACAHQSPTSTSWSGGYARRRLAQGHELEPHLAHWNFLCVAKTQRSWVQYLVMQKKSTFSFSLISMPGWRLNPAHRGHAKFPGIFNPAKITASSATAPAELKILAEGLMT